MLVTINDLDRPVAFDDAGEVLAILRAITRGWSFEPCRSGNAGLAVRRTGEGYEIAGLPGRTPYCEPSAVSAACSLVVEIAERVAAARPDMLCLHAGAVATPGGLVVFPSRRRAGKSTLIARLASLGLDVFADDVLPVVAAGVSLEARALGVASRVRLPLPACLSPEFGAFCRRMAGPEDSWYRYIDPAPGRLVAHGAAAPVRAFVFLDRREGDGAARLEEADRRMALEALMLQNFGLAAAASEILSRFESLVAGAGLYVLRYGALEPAARVVLDAFVGGTPEAHVSGRDAPVALPPVRHRAELPCLAPNTALRRAGAPDLREIDGRVYLACDARGAIFALDGIGGAIWALLDEPVTPREIGETLAEIFPGTPRETIACDVAAFLARLAAEGLVRPA